MEHRALDDALMSHAVATIDPALGNGAGSLLGWPKLTFPGKWNAGLASLAEWTRVHLWNLPIQLPEQDVFSATP